MVPSLAASELSARGRSRPSLSAVQPCSHPFVPYGQGLYFHASDAGAEREAGFCVNVCCGCSIFSGVPLPSQVLSEHAARTGVERELGQFSMLPLLEAPVVPTDSVRRKRSWRDRKKG